MRFYLFGVCIVFVLLFRVVVEYIGDFGVGEDKEVWDFYFRFF